MVLGSRWEFEAIGTKWVIDFFGGERINQDSFKKKILQEIKKFSNIFSRFDDESQVSLASKAKNEIRIPKKYLELVDIYQKLYQLTKGKFTPLVGNLLVDAGYDANYSLAPQKIRPNLKWNDAISYSAPILQVKKPVLLDFGAGGKGFLVDIIGQMFKKEGIDSFCIDAGGDILYRSKKRERLKVGLEHPANFKQVIGVVEIKNQSICASAGNRRKWGKYHHIFDPVTLKSVDKILAVWVVADTALIADCLSTCLFLETPEKFKDFQFEYLIIYPDLSFARSSNFPGEIYTTGK